MSTAAWLGVLLATGALIIGVYYGAQMLRLGRWTARKDFYESCMEAQGIGLSSAACNTTLANPLRPPPRDQWSMDISYTAFCIPLAASAVRYCLERRRRRDCH